MYTLSADGKRGIIPHRTCTVDYKIKPIMKAIRKHAGVKRGEKTPVVRQWFGISLDEHKRMREPRDKWTSHYYPLVEKRMTRKKCLAWMEKNGYPEPPRSACTFCPFHSSKE